ncbi:MAG: sodium:solute symporter family transporter [Synergistaceae bacterium]
MGYWDCRKPLRKCLGFRDSKSLHSAMIIGTAVVGFTMLTMHLAGAMGRAVLPGIEIGDLAIPTITVKLLSPFWAGIFIAGPLAAIMSTVDSMLIICSATIVKDLYFHYVAHNDTAQLPPKKIRYMSLIVTGVIGLIVFFAALNPPSLLVWINLFAFGGLEAVFLWPTLFGLYWERANSTGAMISMLGGCASFFWFNMTKVSWSGTTAIVPTLLIAAFLFIIGSYVGKAESKETIKLFKI